jgi:hypothetical protein
MQAVRLLLAIAMLLVSLIANGQLLRTVHGTAEAAYDESKGKISDLDRIDDGGESIKASGGIRMREHSLDFVLPEFPDFTFNTVTGELNVTDSEGVQQTVKIAFPENADYNSIFPMRVTDSNGSTYQIEPDETGIVEGEDRNGADDTNGSGSSRNVQLKATKIDETETFSPDNLELKYGTVVFEKGDGKYSFDFGTEKWYANSVKLDRFYTPFGRKYVSPWKFIPVGCTDVVKARLEVAGKVNPLEIQFATKDRQTVPYIYDEVDGSWTLTLSGTDANTTYSVYAVYKGSVIGRMHVLSNPKRQVTLTLVPINSSNFNLEEIESQINTIYGEVGVSVTLILKESLRGDYSWEIPDKSGKKDGKLSLTGESFWGYEKEMKESPEMKNLQTLFKEKEKDHSDSPVFFILDGAVGIDNSVSGLLGEMPRQSQFGYLFYTSTSATEKLSHTIAHELGHGLFTLQHTFDREYGKEKSRGTTLNLMDYGGGTELAAFQWNIMSSPAIYTGFDKVEDEKIVSHSYTTIKDNTGITPNMDVILSVSSTNKENNVICGISDAYPNAISRFIVINNGNIISEFFWNGNTYVNNNNKSIEDDPSINLVYNTAKKEITTRIYKNYNDGCLYKYADVKFDPISKSITTIDSDIIWHTKYLWNASQSCILKGDRYIEKCTDNKEIERILNNDAIILAKISENTLPLDLKDIINNCNLISLRRLESKTIFNYIQRIASTNITEESELAILRLMQAINGKDYAEFYQFLEANDNKILKHLIDEMHDASIFFWDGNNYTGFIRALVWMFNCDNCKSIANRWSSNLDELYQRVVNLEHVPYESLHAEGYGKRWGVKYNEGKYIASTGNVEIYEVISETAYDNPYSDNQSLPVGNKNKELVATVSPLTPIMLIPNEGKLSLIEDALGDRQPVHIVPAIFLKYNRDKILKDEVVTVALVTIDIATIVISGGTAVSAEVGLARRLWAIAEVAGAVGNITVNTGVANNPSIKSILDTYNASMALIGFKNIAQSGYKFIKNLPESTRAALVKKQFEGKARRIL